MCIYFTHLFTRTQMDRKIGYILMKQVTDPFFHLRHFRIADTRLDADRQTTSFSRFNQLCRYFWTKDQATAFSTFCYIRNWAAHVDIDSLEAHFCHSNAHFSEKFWLVSPNMGNHRLFIFCKGQSSSYTIFSIWMTETV